MGLSNRQYAAHRGVSHTAVAKVLATGRITAEADGTIDPVKADRQWDAATDPAKQRGVHTRKLVADTARGTSVTKVAGGAEPVPQAAITSANETLQEGGSQGEGAKPRGADCGPVSFLGVRMAKNLANS